MIETILQDMQEPVSYLGYALVISFGVTLVVTLLKLWRTAKWDWGFFLKCLLFLVYIIVLVQMALLSREPGSRTSTDLIPFSTWGSSNQSRAYVIENIIMFIPMGILLPILCRPMQRFGWIVSVMLLVSAGIELTQYITGRGFMQTDDVIMNVLGGIIGFIVFQIIHHISGQGNNRSTD